MEAMLYVVILAGQFKVTEDLEQCSESQEREVMYKFYMGNFCK